VQTRAIGRGANGKPFSDRLLSRRARSRFLPSGKTGRGANKRRHLTRIAASATGGVFGAQAVFLRFPAPTVTRRDVPSGRKPFGDWYNRGGSSWNSNQNH